MPRAKAKAGRDAQEVGAAIIAAWFKALPLQPGGPILSVKGASDSELKATLNAVVDANVTVQYDDDAPGGGIFVVVPRIPKDVKTKADLLTYLSKFHDDGEGRHYHEELGNAVLYGCR